ncbi:tRNA 2-thiocytidine(32) synthetase TtcA [Histomonas meleagridis]|uniref:tRNA 2-thiocytidine(32) synthetase TtcA n=1 Tax=Histomonas meleagridis TaxID=135588 RepID=UPI0035595CF0|nr:tRNA 2-thiocytidine(32) synthetase TtcA [Histomonas meleagridis]KAH0799603.1 tRNA 2-thiocytidine(32) synthetase TtcA [Histomonas meleagridis]
MKDMKKSKQLSKITKRFARQFGAGCGDFNIVNNEGTDHFLIPIDSDYSHLSLLHWMRYKVSKVPKGFKITAVHLYTTDEADPQTTKYLDEFCESLKVTNHYRKVDNVNGEEVYYEILVNLALELDCNKVAIPENLDFLDATIITNMAKNASFDCPSIVQKIKLYADKPEVLITRPFCYINDTEIKTFSELKDFPNRPTGLIIPENPYMDQARKSLEMLVLQSSNVKMNFFRSQFSIQRKYIGTGDGQIGTEDDLGD